MMRSAADTNRQFVLLPFEFVLLLVSLLRNTQEHQRWPIDGLRRLLADRYVNGVYNG